jgi:acyl transferase domain-containing protein/acyl-CoA synthetase (AMP-forming)/AMP-acid ligase II
MRTQGHNDSLIERVQRWASTRGAQIACTFLSDGETQAGALTYAQLMARVDAIAAQLHAHSVEGAPVLILCPAGLEYVASLLACFRAGAIAVPAYPPTRTGLPRTLPRIRSICGDCEPKAVLTTPAVREVLAAEPELRAVLASAQAVIDVDARAEIPRAFDPKLPLPAHAAPALLQYTSGSTAMPKGVLIHLGQLAANLALIGESGLSDADTMLSWLPPYHDMGLIGGILAPLYAGGRTVLMPPDVFLRRPLRWLRAVATHRASVLLTPNFALDACVRRIAPRDRVQLDLSSVQMIYIGAEPVRAQTLERFADAFAGCGLRREALRPCYGMAEATLIVSCGERGASLVMLDAQSTLDAAASAAHQAAASRPPLVGCGRALPGSRICVVDPISLALLGERTIGEVWVQSPSAAQLYWRNPEATERTFNAFTRDGEGPFLRTGDLGFLVDAELFISGRIKDVVIVRGRNHYPQDIEETVQALDEALVADSGAAFAVEREGGEQLVIVQEVDKRSGADPDALLRRIPAAVLDAHEITPSIVVLIKRSTLPKTSSGKVQRGATRDAWLQGTLRVAAELHIGPQASAERPARADEVGPRAPSDIEAWLCARVAAKVGLSSLDIDPSEPVARYGVDSALAAELIEELQDWLQLKLDTTISYDHPTIERLARAVAAMRTRSSVSATHPIRPLGAARVPAGRARLGQDEDDPIAIVGMACRLPGAPDLASFWALLEAGGDAITEVPVERWNAEALYDPTGTQPGKSCSKWGGFIDRIEDFDAAFFGIKPHEAARMDPQQRLFLEVAWHALEDAGQAPSALSASRTGVFAGVCSSDFAALFKGDLRQIDAEYSTGSSPSLVANRVSYVLDLHGASETVDSACSSTLVALQHACQSLLQQDTDLAIVGGVSAVLAPEVGISLSRLGALARDGRCKAFDHRADGFVRSEGAGALVLKRLSSALAAGDQVYALVSACAVNHDGRSNGLTAPSGPAQREVITRALELARVAPEEIDYVEAHGVGAAVADAVELRALAAVMANAARERPLMIGSAKANVGHLEAASGVVSLIKVALALRNERIPRQIHFERLPASLGLDPAVIAVVDAAASWPRGQRPRYAGVSAFGLGGSNAHAVLREAPAPRPREEKTGAPQLFALSARTPSALDELVRDLADHLERSGDALEDVAFTTNLGRAPLRERVAIVAASRDELRDRLLSVALGARDLQVERRSLHPGSRCSLSFVLSEAPLAARPLRELWTAHPVLSAAFELSERVLREQSAPSLRELLAQDDAAADRALARPAALHAATASLQHALAQLALALGLEPAHVYGRGIGEHAAAAASGALEWKTAIALAARRGLLLESLAQGAQQRLSLRDAKQDIAAVEQAFVTPRVPFVSELLGSAFGPDTVPDAAHWTRHLLSPVPVGMRARSALEALAMKVPAAHVCLELGPDSGSAGASSAMTWLAVLGDQGSAQRSLLRALGALFTHGTSLRWDALYAGGAARKVSLPKYPFERERHWLDFQREPAREPRAERASDLASGHPLVSRMRVGQRPLESGFVRNDGGADAEAPEGETLRPGRTGE